MSADPSSPDPLAAGDAGRRVIRGSGLRALAHVVGVGGGLISAPLVVRHLGLGDFGRFATVTAVITIATALIEGGLTSVAIRRLATSDRQQQDVITSNLVGLRLASAMVGAVGAIGFGIVTSREAVVLLGLALGGVALILNSTWGVATTVLTARLRLGTVALVDIVRAGTTTVLLVGLVLGGASLGPFYAVAPVVALVTLVVAFSLLRGQAALRPRVQRRVWGSLLRETALYAAATALGAIYFQVALVTTSLLASSIETGVFSVGFRIIELANGIPWLLAASVFPVFARAAATDAARLRLVTVRTTEASLLLGGLVAVGVLIGAPVAISVVGGEAARDAVPVLRLLGVAALATYLVAAWSFVLLSMQQYRQLVWINAGALALAVVLSIVLVPRFGAMGAAGVTAGVELALATSYGVAIRRARRELGPAAGNLAALGVAMGAALTVGVVLLDVSALLATVAATLVYCLLAWRLRAVPEELLTAVRRR